MTKLSLFDQFFYKAEQAGLPPLYLGGVMIFDPTQAPHRLNAAILADHVAARMEKIPLMRKKIVQDPLRIGSVRMIEDANFDVHNHITVRTLREPGGYAEFTAALGQFSETPLDLTKPPWHYELIDGLAGGRMALAIHVHHAVMDGLGAQDALSSLYDLKRVKPEKAKKKQWRVAEQGNALSLLSSAVVENAERVYLKTPRYLLKSGLPLAKSLASMLTKRLSLKPTVESQANALPPVKKTSLNGGKPSPRRLVSYVELPIEDARAIRKRFECSINDLALLLNSAALEHYFKKTREKVDFDLVAVMPMNAREEGETGPGNILTVGRVNLHNTVPNLALRLKAITRDTALIKSQHRSKPQKARIDGRALMELFSPLVIDSLCFAVAGLNLTSKVMLGNLAVTNVPGSPVPLYLAGAPVVSGVPMAPVVPGITAITVTISSTDKLLLIGYHCDASAIKDGNLFVEGTRNAFAKLKQVATRPSATKRGKKTPTRVAARVARAR